MTTLTTDSRAVTRAEVTLAIRGAFGSGAVHRDMLLGRARANGARREVIYKLAQAPAYRYRDPAQVLAQLPGLRG